MKSFTDRTKRGLLIVFEGIDRVGKSTQVKKLKNYFEIVRNEKCEELAFPSIPLFILGRETKIGKEINDILKNYKKWETKACHLLFSLNRWEKREEILSILESGSHLIVDRYAFSGVAYSSANVLFLFI